MLDPSDLRAQQLKEAQMLQTALLESLNAREAPQTPAKRGAENAGSGAPTPPKGRTVR